MHTCMYVCCVCVLYVCCVCVGTLGSDTECMRRLGALHNSTVYAHTHVNSVYTYTHMYMSTYRVHTHMFVSTLSTPHRPGDKEFGDEACTVHVHTTRNTRAATCRHIHTASALEEDGRCRVKTYSAHGLQKTDLSHLATCQKLHVPIMRIQMV